MLLSCCSALRSIRSPAFLNKFYFLEVFCTTTTGMSELLGDLGTVVTETLGWVGEAVTSIVSQPFLLLTTGILVLGGAIGILGRLLSRG